MANLITNTILVNTDRKLVIKYSELCDGTTATNVTTIVDVSSDDYQRPSDGSNITGVAIDKIYILPSIGTGATGQVAGHIEWATSSGVEVPICSIASDYKNNAGSTFDFSAWGGLTKEGTNANGDIKLDVAGMGANEGYSFILEMRKL